MKKVFAKIARKIASISPEWGNRVMDILGLERYIEFMELSR